MIEKDSFKTSLPSREEMKKLNGYQRAKRTLQACGEAKAYLLSQGMRPTIPNAAELIGVSSSNVQESISHVVAVEKWGINPLLPRSKALARMHELEPSIRVLAIKAMELDVKRSDTEMLADGFTNLIVDFEEKLKTIDQGVLSGALMRFDVRRGATKSALIDLIAWLSKLEKALGRKD